MSPNESPAPPAGLDSWRVFNERFADLAAHGVEPELARLRAFDRAFDEWLNRSFDLVDATTDPNSCATAARPVTQRCSRSRQTRMVGMPGSTTTPRAWGTLVIQEAKRREANECEINF
jgi:hypothetical protein